MGEHPGMGVMIQMLGGDRGAEVFQKAINKKIATVALSGDELHFVMEDGFKFAIADEVRSCCENRYMTCDDNLAQFSGATLLDVEVAPSGKNTTGKYGSEHEIEFLRVKTSRGVITAETHNEHNGYYGGFWVKFKEES